VLPYLLHLNDLAVALSFQQSFPLLDQLFTPGFVSRPNSKEQAAQIQKVSAQLESSKPAPQVVNNP
jgi:hypothetical protein